MDHPMTTGDTVNYYTTNNVVQDPRSMNRGLIELEDGSLVEVEMPEYKVGEELSARFAQRTSSAFDTIEPLLHKAAKPVVNAAKQISAGPTLKKHY